MKNPLLEKLKHPWLTCDPLHGGEGVQGSQGNNTKMRSVPGCTPELLSNILTCKYLGEVLEKMEGMNNCLGKPLMGEGGFRQVVTARVIGKLGPCQRI